MKEIALLVVDMQACFKGVIPEFDTILQRCTFAALAAKLLGIPRLMTEQNPQKLGATCEDLVTAMGEGASFPKMAFSAFGAAELETYLKDYGVQHLLIAGVETPVCIYQTVLDAAKRGFGVTLLCDCIGARRAHDEATVLHTLGQMPGVVILPCETVFYSLLKSCENPQFRAFNELVKTYN